MKHSPKFEKLMEEKKRKGHTLSKSHAKAKSSVIEDLMDDMMGLDSDKVKGLKKVTVAAKDKHGLEKGLDAAKDVIHGKLPDGSEEMMSDGEELAETEEHEAEESPEMEVAEHEGEEESTEEKDTKIAELEAKIAELEAKLDKLA